MAVRRGADLAPPVRICLPVRQMPPPIDQKFSRAAHDGGMGSGAFPISRQSLAGLLAVAIVCACAAAGHFAASGIIASQQTRQLEDLAAVALRRAEQSIVSGTDALEELMAKGLTGCGTLTLQNMRFQVYQRSQIKDVRVASPTGAIRCSAFSETLEFDRSWPTRDTMVATADGTRLLFAVDQFDGTALGLLEQSGPDSALIAILTMNPALFDVLPEAIRDDALVSLELDGGEVLSAFEGETFAAGGSEGTIVSVASDGLPVSSRVMVGGNALLTWQTQSYMPIMALAAALGLALAILTVRAMLRRASPLAELDRALSNHEIKPFLQPIVDLKTGRVIGGEILARWIRPDGEVVPPYRFIPLAEESGRIAALTWNLLAEALETCRPALAADAGFYLSVNIAPKHFVAPEFAAALGEVVKAAGATPGQVCLEITERQPFEDLDAAAAIVDHLQDAGFKVALDDVGIGHSGLSHLQHLGANTLKIDKFFTDSIIGEANARSVVEMLVRLGGTLNMQLVAEGIESAEQADMLRQCGVANGQGFLMSRPLSADAFIAYMAEHRTAEAVRSAA